MLDTHGRERICRGSANLMGGSRTQSWTEVSLKAEERGDSIEAPDLHRMTPQCSTVVLASVATSLSVEMESPNVRDRLPGCYLSPAALRFLRGDFCDWEEGEEMEGSKQECQRTPK